MSYRRLITIVMLFIGGYAGIAAAGGDTTSLIFDWNALGAGLIAAGLAQPRLTDASVTVQIVTTFCAFLVGYGTIESSIGSRWAIGFDWRAVVAGLAASGLVHSNNQNVIQSPIVQPIVQAVGSKS